MNQVLRWWNAANVQHYRLDRQRKHHESTFSVFLNVGSIIALLRGPLLECHSKNIWFRVEQDLTPGSSRNHMQHAAERLSQQLCLLLSSTNTMRNTNTQWLQTWYLFTFLAVQDSSIGDLVTHSLTEWVSEWVRFWFQRLQRALTQSVTHSVSHSLRSLLIWRQFTTITTITTITIL